MAPYLHETISCTSSLGNVHMYPGAHRLKEENIKRIPSPRPHVAAFFVALAALHLRKFVGFLFNSKYLSSVYQTLRGLQISGKQDRCVPCVDGTESLAWGVEGWGETGWWA